MSSDATFKKIRGMAILAIVLYDPLVRKIVVLFEMILEVKDSDGFGCEATGRLILELDPIVPSKSKPSFLELD
jgi:hypothetical protein